MTFAICTQPPTPRMDALPTYKIIDYPLEPRDYKPFAQARLCMTPMELVLELWAFEMAPQPESRMEAVFTTSAAHALVFVTCRAGGAVQCFVRTPQGDRPLDILSHSLDGEDLQGIYWGVSVRIPRTLLEQTLGKGCCQTGQTLQGNIYKRSDSPTKPHHGSLYPADFANGREYALSSLGAFQIVNY